MAVCRSIILFRRRRCLFTFDWKGGGGSLVHLTAALLLLFLAVASCLSAQGAISLKDAFPVTETLRDFQLCGNVREVVTDVPYEWDSEAKRFTPYGDGTIEVLEFNREGYLTAHRYGGQEDGPVEIVSSYEHLLDERNLLRQFRKIDNWNGRVIVSVEYEYVVGEDFIDIKPAHVEVQEGEYWQYRSYQQVFSGGRRKELLIYTHRLSRAPYLAWKQFFTNSELTLVQQWNPDVLLNEQEYLNGRLVLERLNGPHIKEIQYGYQGDEPWPSSELRRYLDGHELLYLFEYTLDKGGNWVERRRYEVVDEEKQPSQIHRREIEYF